MKLAGRISTKIKSVTYVAVVVSAGMIAFSTVAVALDILLRTFANKPILGVSELVEYALIYITFIGSAWLLRQEQHLKLDVLYNFLPKKARYFLDTVSICIILFVVFILSWYGFKATLDFFERGVYNPTLLKFPKFLVVAPIPFGSFLMLLVNNEQYVMAQHGLRHNLDSRIMVYYNV
jgi:TRAP-type C4-dicarboxylate transport system permease small subunit